MRNNSYENTFHLHSHFHANQSHFHLKWFRAETRFETEEKGNSKMVYYNLISDYQFLFRDSLDLAFKYFTSSTLTVRLAGLSQIAVSLIHVYATVLQAS